MHYIRTKPIKNKLKKNVQKIKVYLVSTQWLPCTSRAHGWRVMCPLLPTRMAPTILAATAQVCWSLITPFLVVIIAWWVVWVAPR